MSKINIDRIVKDIKSRTTYLTPIIEAVCNSVDAIGTNRTDGYIKIIVKRDRQTTTDGQADANGNIVAIDIIDNGIGFTDENADSFDTFRSGYKMQQGGKGFGRFMYLKYFRSVSIDSVFEENGLLKRREFTFGHKSEIIENEIITILEEQQQTGSILHLSSIINPEEPDKGLDVIARKLVEKLLVIFATQSETTPTITIMEEDESNPIVLNDYVDRELDIVQVGDDVPLQIQGRDNTKYDFIVKAYKIYFSAITNKICLTANQREVTDVSLHTYVPEFKETMSEIDSEGHQKNFMVKAYVIGKYLDDNVTTERDSFNFDKEEDSLFGISEKTICQRVAQICKDLFNDDMSARYTAKKNRIENYVITSAPWNKTLLDSMDMKSIPVGIDDFELEMLFRKKKFELEQQSRIEIKEVLNRQDNEDVAENIQEIMAHVSEIQKSNLVQYVCKRKEILLLFNKLRQRLEDGSAHKENEIHNLIFPMIKTDRVVEYDDHNLWMLDERFAFTKYIASDKVISKKDKKEPDLAIIYKERMFFRNGENNMLSPVCIVEFKRPKRKDYTAEENPITQACKYSRKILEGKLEMPDGLEPVKVSKESTPVYIYVVSDITPKIKEFAEDASLTVSPDKEGYFGYMPNYHAYVEVMSYKKMYEDAVMRNRIFFEKLGINAD